MTMRYLIDTDIIIDFQNKKDPGFTYFQTAAEGRAAISVVSYSEIAFGMQSFPHKELLIRKFEAMLDELSIPILPVDTVIGGKFAQVKHGLPKGTTLSDFDLLIASTALANNLTLVTRNVKHFSRIQNLSLFSQKPT